MKRQSLKICKQKKLWTLALNLQEACIDELGAQEALVWALLACRETHMPLSFQKAVLSPRVLKTYLKLAVSLWFVLSAWEENTFVVLQHFEKFTNVLPLKWHHIFF